MRHNSVRGNIAFFLREGKCRDVKVEPGMIPVNASHYNRSTITQDDARLDVSAIGVYSPFDSAFFDIRVTHPNCASNEFKNLKQIYSEQEKAKKDAYEERVVQAKNGSLFPLIFTRSGGMDPLCNVFIKQLMEKLAFNKNERTSIMTNHVRIRLRFAILSSTVMTLRGARARGKYRRHNIGLDDVSLDLFPLRRSYEMP
jgi:hypothetical protein